jgi:hypothetical protein
MAREVVLASGVVEEAGGGGIGGPRIAGDEEAGSQQERQAGGQKKRQRMSGKGTHDFAFKLPPPEGFWQECRYPETAALQQETSLT